MLLLTDSAREEDAEEIAGRLRTVPHVASVSVRRSEGEWGPDGRLRATAPKPQVHQVTAVPTGHAQSTKPPLTPPPAPGFTPWEGPPATGEIRLGREDHGRCIQVRVGTIIEIDLTPGYIEGPSWPPDLFALASIHRKVGLSRPEHPPERCSDLG